MVFFGTVCAKKVCLVKVHPVQCHNCSQLEKGVLRAQNSFRHYETFPEKNSKKLNYRFLFPLEKK